MLTQKSPRDISVWGPIFWYQLHIISITYPVYPSAVDQSNMITYLRSLSNLLPCSRCREHFTQALDEVCLQSVTSSREELFIFTVNLHNRVNKRSGKPQMSVEMAKQLYDY